MSKTHQQIKVLRTSFVLYEMFVFFRVSLYKINFLLEFLVAEVCMKIIKIIYNEKYIILQYLMKN